MRLPLAAVLCASLLAPAAHAAKAPAKKAEVVRKVAKALKAAAQPAKLDDEERGKLAVDVVKKSLKGWLRPGEKVTIRAGIVPFNGDPRNPITGAGPVEVYVTAKPKANAGFFSRLLQSFDAYGKQKYLVHVGTDGEANVLERISLAPQRRFARFLSTKLPLGTLAVDFLKSDKATEGAWTAVGAAGSAMVNPWLSGALWMRVAQVVHDGIKSQQQVRKRAMDSTVEWAHGIKKDEGSFPTLIESYRAYRANVEDQQTGARPLELGQFAEALSIRHL